MYLYIISIYLSIHPSIHPSSSSPVRKFLFHVLIWPNGFQKNFGVNHKMSTSPIIPDFQNGGKSPWRPFSYVGSKFKCLQLIYCWKGNFIRINIFLRTKVQKQTYFELMIKYWRDIFLIIADFLLKIVKIWKNDLTKSQLFS